MLKYYKLTEEQLNSIRENLPQNIAFGFESYGSYYFSSETVEKIDNAHGNILSLIFMSLFNKTKEDFLSEIESGSYEKYILQKEKNLAGLDAYEKMIGFINDRGGIGGEETSLDNVEIPGYLLITNIRMMLKDGMFETAMRYWYTEIKPLGVIPQDIENFVMPIFEKLVRKYAHINGVPMSEEYQDALLSKIRVTGKGSL